jgi:hypothetical protein
MTKGNELSTNTATPRAPVDAILIAQAVHRGDGDALRALFNSADLEAVAIDLAGLLVLTIRRVDGHEAVEKWLQAWLRRAKKRIGEDDA